MRAKLGDNDELDEVFQVVERAVAKAGHCEQKIIDKLCGALQVKEGKSLTHYMNLFMQQ